jgi:DNA-binding GntR family transcriptional regulator
MLKLATEAGSAERINVVRTETIRERAYSELRRSIIAGRFKPGEPIVVRVLAEQMGIGLMPVRESIQQLVTEGGFEFLPNRTVRVPVLSPAALEEIFAIRGKLEGFAAAKAAQLMTKDEIAQLKASHDRLVDASGSRVPGEGLAANLAFHFQIYQAARAPHLYEIIERLWLKVGPLLIGPFQASGSSREAFFKTHVFHARLITAISKRQEDVAEELMLKILSSSLDWHRAHSLSAAPRATAAGAVKTRVSARRKRTKTAA